MTTITIPQLPTIPNANISASSILPIVDTTGVPQTDKVTVGNLANFVLTQAGNLLENALVSTYAESVTNAAQPNITSVGTLTGLTGTGIANLIGASNVSLGPVGNIHITGGSNGHVLRTDGAGNLNWSTIVTSGFSNGTSNGSIPVVNGNINFSVNGNSNILVVTGTGANITGTTNIAGNLSVTGKSNLNAVGNVIITGGSNGQVLTTDGAGNLSWVSGVSTGNIIFTNANISTNSLNTNINVIGNGTGEINLSSNSRVWNFGNDGNLLTPGNLIGPANANFVIFSNATAHSFTFGDDGTFYAPDNVVLGGNNIAIGPGADSLSANLTHAVMVASSNGQAYIQAVINNVSDNGSSDWVALGHRGDDDNGWADMGFNSSAFNDANYSLTKRGDGYFILQTFDPNTVPGGPTGGNIIIATGNAGNIKDIIFATGGFLTTDEFARFNHNANAFQFYSNRSANITGANAIIANTFFGNLTGGNLLDSYSTISINEYGYPIIDGSTATQLRTDYSPYMQLYAPDVEIADYGTIPGPTLSIIGYTGNLDQPLSAYISVQDQANATQQWDFGIIGEGDNNFTVRDRTSSNVWIFGTDGNLILPSDSSSIKYSNGNMYGMPAGNNGAVQVNWLGSFSDQGGTPSDTYSTLQFDSNGMPTLNGTAAYQQRVDYSPYLQVLAPRVESTDFGIIAGPGLTVVGYDDNYNTPRSAYLSVQDQANATQQWDFGIIGEGDNNFVISDRTNTNAWTFATDGTTTFPGGLIGNGGGLSNVATQTTGNWELASGVNTVTISVPISGTYSIWINGNIPNGIVTYSATAVVTNTNVPVLGEQYGWYYEAGNALVLTSIPNQFVGTQGAISNASPYSGNTANVFTFGITNNSGANAVVNYGYTKL